MPDFHVKWDIVISAATPEDAAREAKRIHLDPESEANVFDVHVVGGDPELGWQIDLDEL